MTRNSILNKTFALSFLLHGALLALLAFLGTRPQVFSDTPLRVRILEPPAPSTVPSRVPTRVLPSTPTPVPAPQVEPKSVAPPTGRSSSEPSARGARASKATESQEPRAGDPLGGREGGAKPAESREPSTQKVPEGREGGAKGYEPSEGTKSVVPEPPPPSQVAARPLPETRIPQIQTAPDPLRDSPPVVAPARRGLTLDGPPPGAAVLPQPKETPPTQGVPGRTRPSLREQIASLGSGLSGDSDGTAKQTMNLDSQEPEFLPYLARVKRQIQHEWVYPEEAWSRGVSGELLLIFTLNRNGSLTNVRLVQSSGFPILDEEALRAVKQAAPFDPFPPELGAEPWNIAASFRYNLPARVRRN